MKAVLGRDAVGLLFIAPALFIFLAASAFPLTYSAAISFYQWDGLGDARWVGLQNFQRLLVEDTNVRTLFYVSLGNNLKLAVGVTVSVIVISLLLATWLSSAKRLRSLFQTSLLLPMVTAGIAVFYAWVFVFADGGPVNTTFSWLHVSALAPRGGWLSSPALALIGLCLVLIWSQVPYATLFYLSGLQSIDPSLYEAAQIDGARWIQRLRYVSWPLLSPITVIVVILNVVSVMQSYEMVYLMTNGGPTYHTSTVGLLAFNLAFGTFGGGAAQYGMASAIGWLMFIVLSGVTVVTMRLLRSRT